MVQRFDVAVHRVLFGSHIGDDGFGGDVSRVDNTAEVQSADDALEGDAVDFGDNLGVGDLTRMQGQQDVFFIDAGQRDKGFGVFDALLLEQLLVAAVAASLGARGAGMSTCRPSASARALALGPD